MLGIWFVAQKKDCSSGEITPQQGAYRLRWAEKSTSVGVPNSTIKNSLLRKWLKRKLYLLKSNRLYLKKLKPF
jgi:hypothetical protein